jgi:hypothetical protein
MAEEFMNCLGARDKVGLQELFAADIDWYVPGAEQLPWT